MKILSWKILDFHILHMGLFANLQFYIVQPRKFGPSAIRYVETIFFINKMRLRDCYILLVFPLCLRSLNFGFFQTANTGA